MKYCGTAGKPGGNRENKPRPKTTGASSLLEKPIKVYSRVLSEINVEEYLDRDPPATLVADILQKDIQPITGEPGDTQPRLELPLDIGLLRRSRRLPRSSSFVVYPLVSEKRPSASRILLGCAATCDIRIEEVSVSREHAWIVSRDGFHFIEDNESTAGSFLNDLRINPGVEEQLDPWARVRLGRLELTYFDAAEFFRFVRTFTSS